MNFSDVYPRFNSVSILMWPNRYSARTTISLLIFSHYYFIEITENLSRKPTNKMAHSLFRETLYFIFEGGNLLILYLFQYKMLIIYPSYIFEQCSDLVSTRTRGNLITIYNFC